MTIYQLKRSIYLDRVEGEYKAIITIKPAPISQKLKDITKTMYTGKLSIFDERNTRSNPYCEHVVLNPANKELLDPVKDIDIISTYLMDNGFTISHELTNTLVSKSKNNPYKDLIYLFKKTV